jgi:hypothetical protein
MQSAHLLTTNYWSILLQAQNFGCVEHAHDTSCYFHIQHDIKHVPQTYLFFTIGNSRLLFYKNFPNKSLINSFLEMTITILVTPKGHRLYDFLGTPSPYRSAHLYFPRLH